MRNDYEIDIEKNLNEDIKIPENVMMKKNEAFEIIKREKKNKNKKKIIAACTALSVVVLSTVTFADDASAYIREMFFRNNVGAQTAIDNGYVENINDLVMEDKGVKIKVDKFLIDDSRAVVSMKINFENQNIRDIITGLKVHGQLFCDGKEIAVSANHEFTVDESTKEITYNTVFGLEHKVEADKLTFSVSGLELGTDLNSDVAWDESLSEEEIQSISGENIKLFDFIQGNWSTNITIDDKFKNPKIISYKQSEENNVIDVIYAKVTPTGMDVEFTYKGDMGDNYVLIGEFEKPLYDMKITGENGDTFKSNGGLGSQITKDNKVIYKKLFYITSFECDDFYTFEIKDLNGNIQKIKLEKSE